MKKKRYFLMKTAQFWTCFCCRLTSISPSWALFSQQARLRLCFIKVVYGCVLTPSGWWTGSCYVLHSRGEWCRERCVRGRKSLILKCNPDSCAVSAWCLEVQSVLSTRRILTWIQLFGGGAELGLFGYSVGYVGSLFWPPMWAQTCCFCNTVG